MPGGDTRIYVAPIHCSINQFNFQIFDQFDVLKCFLLIKSNAVGYDDINLKFVKLILTCLIPYLTHLLQYFGETLTSTNSELFNN